MSKPLTFKGLIFMLDQVNSFILAIVNRFIEINIVLFTLKIIYVLLC